jgi:biopolymer transport protein ExbD
MVEKRRFFDVWILDNNTVYREVPFQVVTDWLQQGRLLEDDRLRPSGTAEWFRVGGMPEFTPYLPKAEPFRADDQAEALEPVELDFRWRKHHAEEDDDVDMIPLIDVSLVLLIFFMLTASGVAGIFVKTPTAEHGDIAVDPNELVLSIDLRDGKEVFKLSQGNAPPAKEDDNLKSIDELLARLQLRLDKVYNKVEVSINAHPEVKAGVVRTLTARLEYEPFRSRIERKYIGVSEKE